MANPTLPSLTNHAAAVALGATTDDDTGIAYVPYGSGPSDDPTVYTRLVQEMKHLKTLLEGLTGGKVVDLGGLNIGVFALNFMIGTTAYAYAGVASVAAPDSATTYYWVDTDETLDSGAAWPVGAAHFKLAKVVASADDITSIMDCRWMNFLLGITDEWWETVAGGDVDMDDNSIDEVGGLKANEPTNAQISSGAVTYANLYMTIEPETGTTDNLDTITYGDADDGRLLIITPKDSGDVITVRDGIDNIILSNADPALAYQEYLCLISDGANWHEVFRSNLAPTTLSVSLDCATKGLRDIGELHLTTPTSDTISTGSIAYTGYDVRMSILNESGDAADDLDTISGGVAGALLILSAESNAQVVTVKHGTGNIELQNDRDCELATTAHRLFLEYDGTLTKWVEISRSHLTIFDLTGTGEGLRWQPTFYLPDTLADDTTLKMRIFVKETTTIVDFSANVATAPTGGVCVVHILDDSVSIGAASIADGANDAESATLNAVIAASSILEIRTGVHNTADELSVTINGRKSVPAS